MTLVRRPAGPTHTLPGAEFTSLVTPSTGSPEMAVWEVSLSEGHAPTPHSLTRQEVFVVTGGAGVATLDGEPHALAPGDTLVVLPGVVLTLSPGADGLTALCLMVAEGKAVVGDAEPFTPPWAV
jgi:quercetin dioxygenase-like cupin family protein